jgi:HlyD family secretion protein
MKRRTQVIAVLAGVVIASAFAARSFAGSSEDGEGPPSVTVVRGDLVQKALAVGTIEPRVEVSVKSKVSGVVREMFVEEGGFVRAGEPLMDIRPDPTPLELVEARRQLELRGIELATAQAEVERSRELAGRQLIARQDLEAAERRHDEATLQVRMARERLELLERGRVRGPGAGIESVVRAPVTGFVLEKMVETGDPVVPLSTYQEGTVLMTMANMDNLIFRGTVDEIDVGKLVEGMPVEIKVGALPEARIEGVVTRISLKARKQENATTFPVEIELTQTSGATLRSGLSANAEIIIQKREDVLILPERVVTFEGDSAWVMVATANGEPERRTIRTGLSDAIQLEVVSGLAEAERVMEKPARTVK